MNIVNMGPLRCWKTWHLFLNKLSYEFRCCIEKCGFVYFLRGRTLDLLWDCFLINPLLIGPYTKLRQNWSLFNHGYCLMGMASVQKMKVSIQVGHVKTWNVFCRKTSGHFNFSIISLFSKSPMPTHKPLCAQLTSKAACC